MLQIPLKMLSDRVDEAITHGVSHKNAREIRMSSESGKKTLRRSLNINKPFQLRSFFPPLRSLKTENDRKKSVNERKTSRVSKAGK